MRTIIALLCVPKLPFLFIRIFLSRTTFSVSSGYSFAKPFLLSLSLSISAAISREDSEESHHNNHNNNSHHLHHHRSGHTNGSGGGGGVGTKGQYNGFTSDEYLDRLEPKGNVQNEKSDKRYAKRKSSPSGWKLTCADMTTIRNRRLLH